MRKTDVLGFSVSPQFTSTIRDYLKKTGKTMSELAREAISQYIESPKDTLKLENLTDTDLNRVLTMYYNLLGNNPKEILVTGLGIIQRNGMILIGKRKGSDPYIKDLSWVFPGGKMIDLDFRSQLRSKLQEETNLNVEVKDIIHARLIPDSPNKSIRIVALYFNCISNKGKEKAGGGLEELKWVDPTTVCKYFTTSTTDEVMNFLGMIK